MSLATEIGPPQSCETSGYGGPRLHPLVYTTTFLECDADYGCAIYLESSDPNRLFDFNHCSFDFNKFFTTDGPFAKAGGALYIKSSVSCFKFTSCTFTSNAASDGGAIYYISEESSSDNNNVDRNKFAIQINDCCFYSNVNTNTGGAISISIKTNESPRPVEIKKSVFLDNKSDEDDPTIDAPEYGGAIYYSLDIQSSVTSSGDIDTCLKIFDCNFIGNEITIYGGAICIIVANNEPLNPFEIAECSFIINGASFSQNSVNSGHGGAIYYMLRDTPQSSNSDKHLLSIHNCNFSSCFAYER